MSLAPTICFTFDIDWAPEFMIDELRTLLAEHALPATVFCTHESDATRRLIALDHVEHGLHPNFLVAREEAQVLDDLRGLYPGARVARNHALYYHSRLLALLHRAGIEAFSNTLMFLEPGLHPHYDWSGLVRLPIFWEDDVHAVFFDGAFDGAASARAVLALERAELKVLNFHPVHIYLNTSDFDGYQHAKEVLRDEQQARALRRPESGVRTFFEQALAATRDLPRQKLGEVADAFRRDNAYVGAYARTLESP